MQNAEIMELLSQMKISFNLIDIETHTHIMKYSAHKFHCDLWHEFFWRFCQCYSVTALSFNFILFIERTQKRNGWTRTMFECSMEWSFRFYSFRFFCCFVWITSESGALIVSYWRNFNMFVYCSAIIWCSTLANYACSVFQTKHFNTCIIIRAGHTLRGSEFIVQCCWARVYKILTMTFHRKIELIKRFLSRTSWLCIGMQCLKIGSMV